MRFGRKKSSPPEDTQAEPVDLTRVEADQEGEESFTAESICESFLQHGMVGDKYRICAKVGQGGMGTVYKVFDEGLKRTTVLKVLSPDMMSSPQFLKRFVDEARITGQLEHPNIIPVHDIGVVDRTKIYFSMKYVEGEELGAIIRRLRRQDEESAKRYSLYSLLTIFRKVCDAVAFAHSRGIIHRDIKPDNVMVASYGEVMLVDWGLARPEKDADRDRFDDADDVISAMADSSALKTRDGMIKGTPAYMAPEQAAGQAGGVDRRTDIFLLGATLYAIATLHPPYTGENIYDILDSAEAASFTPPGERAPERQIPEELCRIIVKAMAFSPDDRYQTVEALSDDLDSLLEGRTVSVHRRFAAGEVLMKEGERGDEAYLLLSGAVEVVKTIRGQEVAVVKLSEGDTVGEMAMISQAPRSATVRALRDTEVIVITEELIGQGLAKLPPWMGKTIEAVVDRLRAATAQIHPLASGDCAYHVLNQLRLLYPFWGQRATDAHGNVAVALPLAETVDEIAISLCLDKERCALTLARLFDTALLEPVGETHFTVANYALLCRFVDFLRERGRVEAPLWRPQQSTLYAGPGQIVVSHASPGGGAEDEVSEIPGTDPRALLGAADEATLTASFERFHSLLQGMGRPAGR